MAAYARAATPRRLRRNPLDASTARHSRATAGWREHARAHRRHLAALGRRRAVCRAAGAWVERARDAGEHRGRERATTSAGPRYASPGAPRSDRDPASDGVTPAPRASAVAGTRPAVP